MLPGCLADVRRGFTALAVVVLVTGCTGGRGDSIGDPYFPDLGDSGYGVSRYEIDLIYDPATDVLDGMAVVDAIATETLTSFSLDLLGLEVLSVEVGGGSANFDQEDGKLRVEPTFPIEAGEGFATTVRYRGVPDPLPFPGRGDVIIGWNHTANGAFVSSAPHGARTWFPCNDHPADKARFVLRITVPGGLTAVANGTLVAHDGDTWTYESTEQMPTFAATVVIGDLEVVEGEMTSGGVRIRHVLPAGRADELRAVLAPTADMVDFFAKLVGPFPFGVYGVAVVEDIPDGAMEAQTLSVFSLNTLLSPDAEDADVQGILAHELAHQWFGDAIAVEQWRDSWLSEGLATYLQWLWLDHVGLIPITESVEGTRHFVTAWYKTNEILPNLRDPGPELMFHPMVLLRGALTFDALRDQVGDDTFWETIRTHVADHLYGNTTTTDLILILEQTSGQDLDGFLADWLATGPLPPQSTP